MEGQGFLSRARELKDRLIMWRRWFHRHPELSFREKETSAFIARALREMGLQVKEGVGGTYGVVALLEGKYKTPAMGLRADMDALPVQEETGAEYASQHPGIMHACGHDAHMAVLLGVAQVLSQMRPELPGTVVFIFQPGEEVLPGGAEAIIKAGVLDDPPLQAMIGFHVTSYLPVGTVGIKEGIFMAAADNFTVKILGRTSHAAAPHLGQDAVVAAAQLVLALQTLVSRRMDPVQPVVLTVGTIRGGQKENIVAGEAVLEGTVRYLDLSLREGIKRHMEEIIKGVALATGTRKDFQYLEGYPPLYNDPELTAFFKEKAGELLGKEKIRELPHPSMGAEDFARYGEKVPLLYFNLGAMPREGSPQPWHHPRFNIDEDCLPVGVALLSHLTVEFFKRKN